MALFIRRAGGVQVANLGAEHTAGAVEYYSWAFSWPDKLEHDPSKEAVKLIRIDMDVSLSLLLDMGSELNSNNSAYLGFRSGNFPYQSGSTPHRVVTSNWIIKQCLMSHVIGSVCTGVMGMSYAGGRASWEFPEGLIMNPATLSLMTGIENDAATVLTNAGYIGATVYYEWIKASQSDLQAYLTWENLGY